MEVEEDASRVAKTLAFVYVNAKGDEKRVQLTRWRESGLYLQGFDVDGRWKTYRIDRVRAYENGAETWLHEPFQKPPVLPNRLEVKVAKKGPQILFTGFKKEPGPNGGLSQRQSLEKMAEAAGFKVVKSVTQNLLYLVCGATAGPKKIESARAKKVFLLKKPDFEQLVETGELPDVECQRLGDMGRPGDLQQFVLSVQAWAYGVELEHVEAVFGMEFLEGDVFHHKSEAGRYLQVAYNSEDGHIEVHTGLQGVAGSRRGHVVDAEQLAYWLQFGSAPLCVQDVFRGNSKAGLLAWQLASS